MNKRILLVEDNPDDAALALRAFRRYGPAGQLVTAESAEAALELLARRGPPRLVLLDLQLPRMGGLELLRQLRQSESTRRLPVVVMTSSDEEHDIRTAYDYGANSYLRKPVNFHDFVELVGRLRQYWLELNQVARDG